MNDKALVQHEKGLVRDGHSKAILNTDLDAKEAFMKEREEKLSIQNIQSSLDIIKVDMSEIKLMLREISKMRCNLPS